MQTLEHLGVQISVTNFGPIGHGKVDLRPLTVFVGPSNAGKTYLAVLIYTLHRALYGFRKLPFPSNLELLDLPVQSLPTGESDARENLEELKALWQRLDASEGSKRYSDLPSWLRVLIQNQLKGSMGKGKKIMTELKRCFGVESMSELIRMSDHTHESTISLIVREGNQKLWGFDLPVSDSDTTAEMRIEDIDLLPDKQPSPTGKDSEFSTLLYYLLSGEPRAKSEPYSIYARVEAVQYLDRIINRSHLIGDPYYLPAARSGIMQSHRVIASSLVERTPYAGLEKLPVTPLLPGVTADFIRRLIDYNEKRSQDSMRNLASAIETEALVGQVLAGKLSPGGYPDFRYRPDVLNAEIGLSRSSSMVSELAPLVLFLRGFVKRGDTIIIEEPEAHLHPAAQTTIAVALARIVRAGVRVIITTHSDWLLKELANLIREGELDDAPSQPERDESRPAWLRPDEVGVWLFRQGGSSRGSVVEEQRFDRADGVEPDEYYDVAEALYNRSANLQNRLARQAAERQYE